MNNKEQTNSQGKTLIVNPILHKELCLIKIEGDFKSVDEVISKLLESHKKIEARKKK
jgi:hypothetical protein